MVLLDQVVQPATAPVPREAAQLAVAPHLPERTRVALKPVGHDLPRVAGVVPAQGALDEAAGGRLVPLGAEQEVDRLPRAVDGSVEIAPPTADPGECLVDVPRAATRLEMAARALLELRREALGLAEGADVVDLGAAVGGHALGSR